MPGAHECVLEFDPVQLSDCCTVLGRSARFGDAVDDASIGRHLQYRARSGQRCRLFPSTVELSSCLGTLVFALEFERDRSPHGRWDRDALGGQLEILEAITMSDQLITDARRQMRYAIGDVVSVSRFLLVSVRRADRQRDRTLSRVERPQLLGTVGIAEHYPVRATSRTPQPDIDHTVASVVVVPAGPFLIGQRAALDLEHNLTAVAEDDTDITAALMVGQPCLDADPDDIRLRPSPSSQHRLTVEMPQRLRVMLTARRCVSGWVSEVWTANSAQPCPDHDGHSSTEFGVAHGTHQCAVPGQALALERTYIGVCRISRCGHVLPTHEIERDHESVGGTHPKTPCRIDAQPSRAHGKATVAALFGEIFGFRLSSESRSLQRLKYQLGVCIAE